MHFADLLSKVERQTRAVDEIRNPYGPYRGRCDRAPEFTQFFNPHFRRIASDQGGIDRARQLQRCMSLFMCTFETCRRTLPMSADWGRPEVTGRRSKRRF